MNGISGPFHKKIYSLWNRPESLLSENGARCELKLVFTSNSYVASSAPGMRVRGQTTQTFVPFALD